MKSLLSLGEGGSEKLDRKWMKRKVDILGLHRRKLKSVCQADVRNSE